MAIMSLTARIGLGGPRTPRTLRPLGRQSRPPGLGRGDTRLGRQQVHCGARHPNPVRDEPVGGNAHRDDEWCRNRHDGPARAGAGADYPAGAHCLKWPRIALAEALQRCVNPGRECESRQPVKSPESRAGEFAKERHLVAIMTIPKLPHSHCMLPGYGGFRTSRWMNRGVPIGYGI